VIDRLMPAAPAPDPAPASVERAGRQIERLGYALASGLAHRFELSCRRLSAMESLLGAVSHRSVLGRGFSITRLKKGRVIVRSVREVSDRDRLVTQIADGQFESEAINIDQLELFD